MPSATLVAPEVKRRRIVARPDIALYEDRRLRSGTRQWRSRLERSREQILNGLLSLPVLVAVATVVGEVFRSLDATPFSTPVYPRRIKVDRLSLDHPAISPIPLPSLRPLKGMGLRSYIRLSGVLVNSRFTEIENPFHRKKAR